MCPVPCELPERGEILPIGKGRIVRQGQDVAILSLGTRLADCLAAADIMAGIGVSPTVADARFAKPLDSALLDELAAGHDKLLIVEENSPGGFSAHVLQYLANAGRLDTGFAVRALSLPDELIEHDSQAGQLADCGLDCDGIVAALSALTGVAERRIKVSDWPAGSSRGREGEGCGGPAFRRSRAVSGHPRASPDPASTPLNRNRRTVAAVVLSKRV